MPLDRIRIEETQAWLRKATEDLRAASHDLRPDPPLLEDALFHCQQAAEKAMKGFLAWHDVPFRKTHSLEELGEQVLTIAPVLRECVDDAVPLTAYAWKFRYPGEPEKVLQGEVEESLRVATQTYERILSHLPPVVQSAKEE